MSNAESASSTPTQEDAASSQAVVEANQAVETEEAEEASTSQDRRTASPVVTPAQSKPPRAPTAKPRFCRSTLKLVSLEGVAPNTDQDFSIERADIASNVEDTDALIKLARDGAIEALWLFAEERGQQVKELQSKLDQIRAIAGVNTGKRKSSKRSFDSGPGALDAVGAVGAGPGAGAPPISSELVVKPSEARLAITSLGSIKDHTAISAELSKSITDAFELCIDHELHDRNGNPYVTSEVFGGDRRRSRSRGTLCGAFPHAMIDVAGGAQGGDSVLVVTACHQIILSAYLRPKASHWKNATPPANPEAWILDALRKALPAEEVEKWGRYESSLVFNLSLVFEDGSTVCADDKDLANFCFKTPLENGKLLVPHEKPVGQAGYYEQAMAKGKVEWRFLTNTNVTSFQLVASRKHTHFAFKVEVLCPYLKDVEPLTIRSEPFIIKSVISNDLQASERYVRERKEGVSREHWPIRVALLADVRRIPPMAVRRRSNAA